MKRNGIVIDYNLAHSAAWDEGNRNAEKNGRKEWNEDDWNVACHKFEEIMPLDTYMRGRNKLIAYKYQIAHDGQKEA